MSGISYGEVNISLINIASLSRNLQGWFTWGACGSVNGFVGFVEGSLRGCRRGIAQADFGTRSKGLVPVV